MAYVYVVIDGLIQSIPSGDIVKLRGPLDIDTYLIGFLNDAIIEPAAGFALHSGDGDPRGAYAVDLQPLRADNTQVASGDYAIIGGGENNKATGVYSVVGGGSFNFCDGSNSIIIGGWQNNISGGVYNVVGGGQLNIIAGSYDVIGGGGGNNCYVEANYSTIFGGFCYVRGSYAVAMGGSVSRLLLNTNYSVVCGGTNCGLNTNNNPAYFCEYAFIGGGYISRIENSDYSVVVAGRQCYIKNDYGCQVGGLYNSIDGFGFGGTGIWLSTFGTHSVAVGGYTNIGRGAYSSVLTGRYNEAIADYTLVIGGGLYGEARLYGGVLQANGKFGILDGSSQIEVVTLRNQTVDASVTSLFLDGIALRLTLPANITWLFNARITGHRDTATESAAYHIRGVIRREGINDPVLVGSLKVVLAEDDITWDANVQVDTVNDALEFTVLGAVGKTINWTARIEIIEVGI